MRVTLEYLLENHADLVEALRAEGAAGVSLPEITSEYLEQNHADLVEGFEARGASAAATAERERIQAIQELTIGGHEDLATEAINDGSTPEVFAMRQVKAEKSAGSAALRRIQAAEEDLDAPDPAAPADDAAPDGASADVQGKQLASMSPRMRRKQAASG